MTADIIPCTRREFEEEKHEIDSLPRATALRGRKIYEREITSELQAESLSGAEP